MEKYAVIKLASKQFLVREGDVIELERQKKPLDIKVLFCSDGEKANVGEPEVKGVSIKASVLEEKLGKKVRVARFKSKSRYDKVKGHRQPISIVKIDKIILGKEEEKPKKEEKTQETKKKTKKKVETKKPKTGAEKKKSPGRPSKKSSEEKSENKEKSTKKSSKSSKGNK